MPTKCSGVEVVENGSTQVKNKYFKTVYEYRI